MKYKKLLEKILIMVGVLSVATGCSSIKRIDEFNPQNLSSNDPHAVLNVKVEKAMIMIGDGRPLVRIIALNGYLLRDDHEKWDVYQLKLSPGEHTMIVQVYGNRSFLTGKIWFSVEEGKEYLLYKTSGGTHVGVLMKENGDDSKKNRIYISKPCKAKYFETSKTAVDCNIDKLPNYQGIN